MDPENGNDGERELTIDEELAADWKAIKEKYSDAPKDAPKETAPAAEAAAEPVSETPDTETPESEQTAAERARDEQGRFAKKDAPASAEASAVPETPAQPVDPAAAPRDINRAPSSWKPAAKAAWANLPPDIRAEIQRREGDYLNGQKQLLPDAQFGKSMRDVVSPYLMLIQAEGGTPERAVADLLRTASVLRMGTPQQKTAAIQAVMQQFGVQLPQQGTPPPADGTSPAPQQAFYDPRVDQLLQQQQQAEMVRQQQERDSAEAASANWLNELDDKGNPKRPYVENVMTQMSALIPLIKRDNPSLSHVQVLDSAYEQATWAHPEVRPVLEQQKLAEAEARRRAENQQRVNLAKQAASVNVPRRGFVPAPAKPGSMDDTIRETARQLGFISS